jgi:hypothetical protein
MDHNDHVNLLRPAGPGDAKTFFTTTDTTDTKENIKKQETKKERQYPLPGTSFVSWKRKEKRI